MRNIRIMILCCFCASWITGEAVAQKSTDSASQNRVDSLVQLLKKAGREWNEYAIQLLAIGEPAVPALIETVEDKNLEEWPRRVASMTLADFHSKQSIDPCLTILFDQTDNQVIRNGMCAVLRGFDLSSHKDRLWELFQRSESWFQLNLASLLDTSDPELAFLAYQIIYEKMDGYGKQQALIRLVELHPEESNALYLKGLQTDDWMTGNLAMDSLVTSKYLIPSDMLTLFHDSNTSKEIRWRIVYIFSHRSLPESESLLREALEDTSWLVRMEAKLARKKTRM